MQITIFLLGIISACFGSEPDFSAPMKAFKHLNLSENQIAVGKVKKFTIKYLKPNWPILDTITLDIESTIASSKGAKKLSTIECKVLPARERIVPYESRELHRNDRPEKEDRLLAFIGSKKDGCQFVHLSKVRGQEILWPIDPDKPTALSLETGKKMLGKAFDEQFHNEP